MLNRIRLYRISFPCAKEEPPTYLSGVVSVEPKPEAGKEDEVHGH